MLKAVNPDREPLEVRRDAQDLLHETLVRDDLAGTDEDDGLLAAALPIIVGAYGVALALAALTFWGSGEALLMVAICTVYAAMFFGVPAVMARIRNRHDRRWLSRGPNFTADRVEISGGVIRRREALLQMVVVPVGVAMAFAAFAIIWSALQP